jgi:hypothetical protein
MVYDIDRLIFNHMYFMSIDTDFTSILSFAIYQSHEYYEILRDFAGLYRLVLSLMKNFVKKSVNTIYLRR